MYVDMGKRQLSSGYEIREYWGRTDIWHRKGFADPESLMTGDVCFACGIDWGEPAERAHIVPRCEGGSDGPGNLHMLCCLCHKDSEFKSGPVYWQWFWERTPMDRLVSGAVRSGLNLWSTMLKYGMVDPDTANCLGSVVNPLEVFTDYESVNRLAEWRTANPHKPYRPQQISRREKVKRAGKDRRENR
jgi:hypothetical protein